MHRSPIYLGSTGVSAWNAGRSDGIEILKFCRTPVRALIWLGETTETTDRGLCRDQPCRLRVEHRHATAIAAG
jgi:hypothetical protein